MGWGESNVDSRSTGVSPTFENVRGVGFGLRMSPFGIGRADGGAETPRLGKRAFCCSVRNCSRRVGAMSDRPLVVANAAEDSIAPFLALPRTAECGARSAAWLAVSVCGMFAEGGTRAGIP
jgi:hypothetical protein